MKKTNMLLAVIAWLLIVSLVFMGIWPSVQENILQPYLSGERQETGPNAATGSGQSGNQITEFTPRNVIELGDSFEYYPHMAEGLPVSASLRRLTNVCPKRRFLTMLFCGCIQEPTRNRRAIGTKNGLQRAAPMIRGLGLCW